MRASVLLRALFPLGRLAALRLHLQVLLLQQQQRSIGKTVHEGSLGVRLSVCSRQQRVGQGRRVGFDRGQFAVIDGADHALQPADDWRLPAGGGSGSGCGPWTEQRRLLGPLSHGALDTTTRDGGSLRSEAARAASSLLSLRFRGASAFPADERGG